MSSIDLTAVVQACRELSAETDPGQLRDRVAEVAGALTGATAVRLRADHDAPEAPDDGSVLVVPAGSQGMLVLEKPPADGGFDSGCAEVAGLLAVSVGHALAYGSVQRELAAADRRLDQLGRTDALTGLVNRRDFDEQLLREWKRAARAEDPLAVVLIDVDRFKAYNDRYGHPAGDACLRHVSSVIRRTVRETDVAARFGGEEFALILPGATVAEAWVAAERVRSAVAAAAEPHADGVAGVVTISLGVASLLPADGGDPDKLLEDADLALYEAKRSGRDQVRPAINNLSS